MHDADAPSIPAGTDTRTIRMTTTHSMWTPAGIVPFTYCRLCWSQQSHWLSPAVTADSIPLRLQRNITTQVSPFICCHPSMMPPRSFRQRRGSLAPRQLHLLKMIECSILERNSCCDQSLQSTLEKTWGGSIWNHWVPLQWQQCWSQDLESQSFFSWTHNKKTSLSQHIPPTSLLWTWNLLS